MTEDKDRAIAEADEAIAAGEKLVSAQEARIAEMRRAGVNVSRAETLLEAYRHAVRVAMQNRDALLNWFQRNRSSTRKDEHDV